MSTVEGEHYKYKKNAVLLRDHWKKISLTSLGNNIQPEKDQELNPHGFGCNGCQGCPEIVGEARYICLACRSDPNYQGDYIDCCSKCM